MDLGPKMRLEGHRAPKKPPGRASWAAWAIPGAQGTSVPLKTCVSWQAPGGPKGGMNEKRGPQDLWPLENVSVVAGARAVLRKPLYLLCRKEFGGIGGAGGDG